MFNSVRNLVRNLGPKPTNSLNGDAIPPRSMPETSSGYRRPSPTSAKRRKVVEGNGYTNARLVPQEDETAHESDHLRVQTPSRRRDSGNSSQSITLLSSSTKTSHTNIPEFRSVDSQVRQGKNRQRKRNHGQASTASSQVISSDEEQDQASQQGQAAQLECGLEQLGGRFKRQQRLDPHTNGTKRKAVDIMGGHKHRRSSSPDELGVEEDDVSIKPRSRRTMTSPSESKRGVIQPSTFSLDTKSAAQRPNKTIQLQFARAKSIVGSKGLEIVRGVAGPYSYPVIGDSHLPCFLRIHEVSSILLPTSDDGHVLHDLAYLTVDLKSVQKVWEPTSADATVVAVLRTMEVGRSAAPKVHFEFKTEDDLKAFLRWLKLDQKRAQTFKWIPQDGEKLRKELMHSASGASKHKVLRDPDTTKSEVPDDIKLMEQNQKRLQEKQASIKLVPSDDPVPRPTKVKDSMQTSEHTASHVEPVQVHGSPVATRAPVTRARTRTSAARDPSPPPESWTKEHPEWEADWQGSLVWPPQARSRAIVDKSDVPRLDEGEYLNDNLITFYLRYLEHQLEEKRPDIAKRVYFHNTFFFNQLKPTKSTSGMINYDNVKTWTSKVDLFSKDFIIVPINEYVHWFVAIIYKPSKLVPAAQRSADTAHTGGTAETPVDLEDNDALEKSEDKKGEALRETQAQDAVTPENVVVAELSQMSIDSPNEDKQGNTQELGHRGRDSHSAIRSVEGDDVVDLVQVSSEVPAGDKQTSRSTPAVKRKQGKRASTGPRKHDPEQPKIITLDSLGSPHSPVCKLLRAYLVAELKDKRNIEIEDPGPLGMTAKGVPEQSNHCDCGLYLLGYIEQMLKDPDSFVHSLLQHEHIPWNLDPSKMRNDIRQLLLHLQKEQIGMRRHRKREVGLKKRQTVARSSVADAQRSDSQSDKPTSPTPDGNQAVATKADSHTQRTHQAVETVDASTMLNPYRSHTSNSARGSGQRSNNALTTPGKDDYTVSDEASKSPINPEPDLPLAVPGSYPAPASKSSKSPPSRASHELVLIGGQESEDFIPLLPTSPRGDSPDKPVDLDSPTNEVKRKPQASEIKIPKKPEYKIEIQIPQTIGSVKRPLTHSSPRETKATSSTSSYFGTHRGPQEGETLIETKVINPPPKKRKAAPVELDD